MKRALFVFGIICIFFHPGCSGGSSSRISESTVYNRDGSIYSRFVYLYNNAGIRTGGEFYDKDGVRHSIDEYIYKTGRLQEIVTKNADSDIIQKLVFSYKDKTIEKEVYYNSDDEIIAYNTYGFENGQKTIQTQFDKDNKLIGTCTFKYEGGRRTETLLDNKQYSTRIYGGDGNLAQVNYANGTKLIFKWENKKTNINQDDIVAF
jgi:hypothetical protein